jgi:hypothetical protein
MRHAYYGNRYGYRFNPGFTMSDFVEFLSAKGMERAAYLVGKYPDVVEPFLPKIEERLRAKGLLAPVVVEEVVEDAALTDAQAWDMLADLVPTALSDQPKALQDALVAAFREEARRAA